MGERGKEGVWLGRGEGGGVTLGAGGHQCTAAKLMPVFFPLSLLLRHRKAECGCSLTETSKHTGGKNEFMHCDNNLFYQKNDEKYPDLALT